MSWDEVPISEFCKTGSGSTPSRTKVSRYYGGNIPWVKSGELREDHIFDTEEHVTEDALKETAIKLVPSGALLIAMYGATVGRMAILKTEAATNQAVCHVVPDYDKADVNYLYRALRAKVPYLLNMRVGGGQPNISQKIIKDTKILLPPLPEQRRIAAILDKADAIRRKRQEAIRLTEEFLRSVFLDMFGDPVTNPKGWEVVTIRDLVSEVKYGSSEKAGPEGRYPMLRMNNITYEGGWDFSSLKYVDLSEKDLSKYLVQKGDLLFNRTNSKELVGKTAVFIEDKPMAYAGYLIRVRPNTQNTSEYISGYLNSDHGKKTLVGMCKSIIGMANINAQELQNIKILKAPLEVQKKYQAIVRSVSSLREKLIEPSNLKDELFNSLVQLAFRGDI